MRRRGVRGKVRPRARRKSERAETLDYPKRADADILWEKGSRHMAAPSDEKNPDNPNQKGLFGHLSQHPLGSKLMADAIKGIAIGLFTLITLVVAAGWHQFVMRDQIKS